MHFLAECIFLYQLKIHSNFQLINLSEFSFRLFSMPKIVSGGEIRLNKRIHESCLFQYKIVEKT